VVGSHSLTPSHNHTVTRSHIHTLACSSTAVPRPKPLSWWGASPPTSAMRCRRAEHRCPAFVRPSSLLRQVVAQRRSARQACMRDTVPPGLRHYACGSGPHAPPMHPHAPASAPPPRCLVPFGRAWAHKYRLVAKYITPHHITPHLRHSSSPGCALLTPPASPPPRPAPPRRPAAPPRWRPPHPPPPPPTSSAR
jgi:hypothetical protein